MEEGMETQDSIDIAHLQRVALGLVCVITCSVPDSHWANFDVFRSTNNFSQIIPDNRKLAAPRKHSRSIQIKSQIAPIVTAPRRLPDNYPQLHQTLPASPRSETLLLRSTDTMKQIS